MAAPILTEREIMDRVKQVASTLRVVYGSEHDDLVELSVDMLVATEGLSLDSLKHIRQLVGGT